MSNGFSLRAVAIALLALGAACTVKQDKIPSLTGPSEFGLSITITATPDAISQDGASQSAIVVFARGPNGAGITGVPLRLDIAVGGVVQDFGTLSTKNIVTASDGRAAAVYTAPPAPPPAAGGSGNLVTIIVTPTGSNFQAANSQSADIRLVPVGVILPPAQTPTASFTFSPTPALVNLPIAFDASRSCAGSGGCTSTAGITSFQWTFGDGTTGSGQTTTKTFTGSGTFSVTLTVTNDRGVSASTTQSVSVNAGTAPTASFVFSPASPQVLQVVQFNAETSRAAAGRTIASYAWDFGDGVRKTGATTTHDFDAAGDYNVVLTVTDDLGQKGTTTQTVTVTAGSGGLTADFTFSPTDPISGALVTFNANTSSPISSITSFTWDFGDGTTQTTSSAQIDHTYFTPADATFTVRLTVRDTTGRTATTTKTVPVDAGNDPIARFTISPSPATVNQTVTFEGSPSSAVAPATISRYEWNFGDGSAIVSTTAPTTSTTHAYSTAGTYTIRLTVFDNSGRSGTTSHTLIVQ